MKSNNSLDLISDINKVVSKMNKSGQRGGSTDKLENYKNKKYSFLSSSDSKILKSE